MSELEDKLNQMAFEQIASEKGNKYLTKVAKRTSEERKEGAKVGAAIGAGANIGLNSQYARQYAAISKLPGGKAALAKVLIPRLALDTATGASAGYLIGKKVPKKKDKKSK